MNIFEHAMQMEKDGEEYYRRLAESAGNEGLKSIFYTLADNEVEHYNAFKSMKDKSSYNFKETKILEESKNVFIKLKNQGGSIKIAGQKEAYQQALDIEKKSIDYYEELENKEIGSDIQKEIISKIKEEEKKHYFLIGNIIDFISRAESWLENAEWNHLDDY